MFLWIYFPLLAVFFAYMSKHGAHYNMPEQLFRVILVLWLSWLIAFGGAGMTDQEHYSEFYRSIHNNSFSGDNALLRILLSSFSSDHRESYEVGYVFLNVLFNRLGISYVAFMFAMALMTHVLLVDFIYKYRFPTFIILIYIASIFYTQQANLVRQMTAVAIFLYAFQYIEKRSFIPYFLCVLVAITIHLSAVLLVFVYFLPRKIPGTIVLWGAWLISVYISYKGLDLPVMKIGYYSLQKFNRAVEESGPNLFYNVILAILLVINPKRLLRGRYTYVFNMFFIGVLLLNLTSITFYFYRLSFYFSIFSIIIIPLIPVYLADRFQYIIPAKVLYPVSQIMLAGFYLNILVRRIFADSADIIGHRMYDFMDLFK